jgi:hypothetical protein
MNPRDETVQILYKNDIATCLWGEDALRFYDIPTVVFELYILVPDDDLNEATTILSSNPSYRHVPPNDSEMRTNPFRQVFLKYWSHRFLGTWSEQIGVQLLPVEEFAHFVISTETTVERGFCRYPTFSVLLEGLVRQYLEPVENRVDIAYRGHVMMHLGYLMEYALKGKPERHSVLEELSPRAHKLWKDMLEEKFVPGEKGREIYRNA